MAEVLVQNMRDPSEQITIMVTIRRMIVMDYDPLDPVWVLEASTKGLDGAVFIPPIIKYLSSHDTLTEDINEVITELCNSIGWTYIEDTSPPEVTSHWPINGATEVSVDSTILINLSELAPSSGIDLSSIKVKVKGFDLTDQVIKSGDLRQCSLRLTPGTKYKSAIKDE